MTAPVPAATGDQDIRSRARRIGRRARKAIRKLGFEAAWLRLWAPEFLKWWGMVAMMVPFFCLVMTFVDSMRDVGLQRKTFSDDALETERLERTPNPMKFHPKPRVVFSGESGLLRVKELVPEDGDYMRLMFFFTGAGCMVTNFYMILWVNAVFLQNYAAYEAGTPPSVLLPKLQEYHFAMDFNHLLNIHLAAFVAVVDMIGLSALLGSAWSNLYSFYSNRHRNPFDAFKALAEIFSIERKMEIFSTMFLVGAAHPAHLGRRFERHMAAPPFGSPNANKCMKFAQAAYFAATRAGCGIMGLIAFGVKMTLVSVQMGSPFLPRIMKVVVLGAFLCQVLGAVIVDHMLKQELLHAVFSADHDVGCAPAMEVFMAHVYERMFLDYWRQGRRLHFLMLAMTFDHTDLQQLVFQSAPNRRASRDRAVTSLA